MFREDPLSLALLDSSATRSHPVARLLAAILGGNPSNANAFWGSIFFLDDPPPRMVGEVDLAKPKTEGAAGFSQRSPFSVSAKPKAFLFSSDKNEAEAQDAVAVGRKVSEPSSRTTRLRVDVPTTTPLNTLSATVTEWVFYWFSWVVSIHIFAPFPYVAVHIAKAPVIPF